MNKERSKKNKDTELFDKSKLWNVFESEVINPDKPKEPLECLYSNVGNRETCERCQFSLAFSDCIYDFVLFFFFFGSFGMFLGLKSCAVSA